MRPSSASPIASSHQQYTSGTSSHRMHQLLIPPRPSDPPLRPGWGMPSMLKPYRLFLVHFHVLLKTFCTPSVVECCPNYWDFRSTIKKKIAYFLFNEELKWRHKLACKHSECVNISICRLRLVVLSTFIQLVFLFDSVTQGKFILYQWRVPKRLACDDWYFATHYNLINVTDTDCWARKRQQPWPCYHSFQWAVFNRTKDWVNNPCVYLSIPFLLTVSLPLLCFGPALMQGPPRSGGLPER